MAPRFVEMVEPSKGTDGKRSSVPYIPLDGSNKKEKRDGFGAKSITWWGSFCLNLNNCMGPAMVLLPLVNQQVCAPSSLVALVSPIRGPLVFSALAVCLPVPARGWYCLPVPWFDLFVWYAARCWWLFRRCPAPEIYFLTSCILVIILHIYS